TFPQFGPIAEGIQETQVEEHQDEPRIAERRQIVETVDQGVEDGSVFLAVFGQQVDKLREVVRVCGQVEVLADRSKGFERVHLGDDVEFAANREEHIAQGERLEVSRRPRGAASYTPGDRADLADLAREQRDDAIRFAEVSALEDDRGRAIQTLPG